MPPTIVRTSPSGSGKAHFDLAMERLSGFSYGKATLCSIVAQVLFYVMLGMVPANAVLFAVAIVLTV